VGGYGPSWEVMAVMCMNKATHIWRGWLAVPGGWRLGQKDLVWPLFSRQLTTTCVYLH
jgi:hypothetical protein